jgi:glycosyltransferase involved in cell wall biosynthesis
MSTPENNFISIVVPVFNSANTLESLCDEVDSQMRLAAIEYELILVEDGSKDESWNKICELKTKYEKLRGYRLHKNSGQHKALICGISKASGNWIVTLDDDLQFSPSDIKTLLDTAISQEASLVYGIPHKSKKSFFRSLGSKFLTFIFNHFADLPVQGSSFKIFKSTVAEKLRESDHPFLFIDEVLCWHAHQISVVSVNHIARKNGKSNYSFLKLIKIGLKYIISYTTFPLRMITYFGLAAFFICLTFIIYFLYMKFTYGAELGFTATIISIFMSSGLILFCIGVIGEYLNRLFLLQSGKPNYIIKSEV